MDNLNTSFNSTHTAIEVSNHEKALISIFQSIQKIITGANRCYDLTHALENIKEYREAAVKSTYDKSINLEIVRLISGEYRSTILEYEGEKIASTLNSII